MHILYQGLHRDGQRFDFDFAHVGTGEEQQFVDDAGHSIDLFIALKHRLIIF